MTQPVWGATAQGFSMKPQPQIQQDMTTSVLATLNAAIDTSPTEPLGQLIGILSEAVAEVWEVLATCYEGIDRDNAEGDQLDNVGTLTGSLREAPTASQVVCTVTLAAGFYPPGSLVAAVSTTGPMTTETPSSGAQFANVNGVSAPGGPWPNVLFQALQTGPNIAPAGWLTTVAAPVTGWTAITNPSDANVGQNLQDDTAYRATQELELTAGGGATLPSITAALLELFTTFGLTGASVNVVQNTAIATDPVSGLPGKSFEVYVYAGSGNTFASTQLSQIAQTIWDEKPAGIQLVGSTTIVIFDSQGVQRSVLFSLVSPVTIYLQVTVFFAPSVSIAGNQAATASGVKSAIQALANGETTAGDALAPGTPGVLVPGGTVYASAISSAALAAGGVTGVLLVQLDVTASPSATNNLWGQNDAGFAAALSQTIKITSSQVGSVLTANISIVDAITGSIY